MMKDLKAWVVKRKEFLRNSTDQLIALLSLRVDLILKKDNIYMLYSLTWFHQPSDFSV